MTVGKNQLLWTDPLVLLDPLEQTFATPVINFPEVAILGFNKIEKKPVVKTIDGKDEIVIRDWTLFSISLDHRIVDGAIGAEFMKLFIQYIENPSLLIMA